MPPAVPPIDFSYDIPAFFPIIPISSLHLALKSGGESASAAEPKDSTLPKSSVQSATGTVMSV